MKGVKVGLLGAAKSAYQAYNVYQNWSALQPASNQMPNSGRTRTRYRRRRRNGEMFVVTNDYTRATRSLGRAPKKNLYQAWKRINQSKTINVYAWRSYSDWGGVAGKNKLNNTSASPSTGTLTCPCHLYDVTASLNILGTPGGTITAPNIRWDVTFSNPNDTGNLTWVNTSPLALEKSSAGSSYLEGYPLRQDILDWIQFKLLFYCPTQRPSKFLIQLVQFNDERLVPGATVTTFSSAFWQSMVKKFMWSPLETGDNQYNKYLKVLYSMQFSMDPKESTDPANTKLREVNIFKRMNRRCTYDWQQDDRMFMNQEDGQQNSGDLSTTVHPRARVFLMIRALASNGAAESNTIHPSYDLVYRCRHSNSS